MSSELLNKITADIKEAMKSKDKEKLTTLRTLHSEIKNIGINQQKEITDADIYVVLEKGIKQRQDAFTQYTDAKREDLAEQEKTQIAIYKSYQPQQMTEEEIEETVKNAISECGASSKKDMGKVMKALMPLVKGKADGKMVNTIVSKYLQ